MITNSSKSLADLTASAEFKALFKTKPHLHALAIVANWAIIIGAVYVFYQIEIVWLYPMVVLIVGARMHALAILMHDATHFRFLKNRKWNDLISNLTIMYPIFTSIEVYRRNHLSHHQHLNTENDPDWAAKLGQPAFTFPKTKAAFLWSVVSYFALYQGLSDAFWFLKRFGKSSSKKVAKSNGKFIKISFYILLFSALTYFGGWLVFLLFWVVPYFSTFFMYQYIRSVAEHFGDLAYEDDFSSSRTVRPTLLEKFFLAPHEVGYHLEHHLYPGVPFYHLPKLHQLLMQQEAYQAKAHITHGYFSGLLEELTQREVMENSRVV